MKLKLSNKNLIVGGIGLVVLILVFWYFFGREEADVPNVPDPYGALRADPKVGPWKAATPNNSLGMVVWKYVLGIPEPAQAERDRLKNAALAFFKGYNMQPDGWIARDVLSVDINEFLERNPTIHYRNVRVGQFI